MVRGITQLGQAENYSRRKNPELPGLIFMPRRKTRKDMLISIVDYKKMKRFDLTNKRFGRLIAQECIGKNKRNYAVWLCVCDCGKKLFVASNYLKNGDTKSCGCLNRDSARQRMTTHSMSGAPAYSSWHRMKQRCLNIKDRRYKDYGGRGIIICEQWLKFEKFFEDMGERPYGLTLDRIDNGGNYEPSNCRWATNKEQANNRRKRRIK